MDKNFYKEKLNIMVDEPVTELRYGSPFEFLIAVILSAQCTDKRVNEVTKELFKTHYLPEHFARLPQEELEEKIHSCGFFRNKAKNIISMSRDVLEKFGGEIPKTIEDLQTLAGVGIKTANVVASEVFKIPAFAVDTHVFRVANRLEIAPSNNVEACERQLCEFFDREDWSTLHKQFVLFGRYICKAQRPECQRCEFNKVCPYYLSLVTREIVKK